MLAKEGVFSIRSGYFYSFIVFVTNILMRLIDLTKSGLWYDEVFTVFHSQESFGHILDVAQKDTNPPVYNFLLSVYMDLFGNSEFSVRFFGVLIASLTAVLLFYTIWKHFDLTAAAISSLLFLTSDLVLFYSQETRSYVLVVLLAVASVHFLLNFVKEASWKNAIWLGVVFTLGMYTHFCILFLFVVEGLFLILYRLKSKKHLTRFGITILVSIGLFAFWLPYVFKGADIITGKSWLKFQSFTQILPTYKAILGGDIWWITLLSLTLLGIYGIFLSQNKNYKKHLILFLAVFTLCPLLAALVSFSTPIYYPRYLVYVCVFVYAAIAVALSTATNKYVAYSIGIALTVVQAFYLNPGKPKNQDIRSGVEYLNSLNIGDSTIVLVQSPGNVHGFAYYYFKESFDDPMRFSNLTYSNNIFPVLNAEGQKPELYANFKSVILFQTFTGYCDPNNTIKKRFKELFELTDTYSGQDVSVSYFRNSNSEPIAVYNIVIDEFGVWKDGELLDTAKFNFSVDQKAGQPKYHLNAESRSSPVIKMDLDRFEFYANTYFTEEAEINQNEGYPSVHFIMHPIDANDKGIGWYEDPSPAIKSEDSEWVLRKFSFRMKYQNVHRLKTGRFYVKRDGWDDSVIRNHKITLHNVRLKE